jgi:hypothetical protein
MSIFLDQGYHLDQQKSAVIDAEVEFQSPQEILTWCPTTDESKLIEVSCEFSIDVLQASPVNLIELVPEKFRSSQILIDFLDECSLAVGGWLTDVTDIIKLLNPYTISSTEYLRHLGALIDVKFPPEDTTSEDEMRKTLIQAVDWYKVKGTYESIQIISLIQQLTINLYDMYTNDYEIFHMVDWFVGDENENPPGFDSSYYKSPHFGVEVLLNKVYQGGSGSLSSSGSYLWEVSNLNNLLDKVNETRPVHTVPHYFLLLNPKTDEFGHIIEVDGEIFTKITGNWEPSTKYFDMAGSNAWNFDDGTHFDQSAEGFVKSITKWVLGTGDVVNHLGDPGVDLISPVTTGSIDPDDIVISDEKITFEFIVPKAVVQSGITELGLYVPGVSDILVLASGFPRIDKDSRVELHVIVEVYKKSLV